METYNKKYKIVAPDGYVEEWSQADFEKGGAALMSDNPDVKVYSQESYDPTQQYGTNVAYGIEDEDGYFESWTADEWSKGKDALLKDHPNLKIYVLGDASQDYHRQKAEEQRQAITDFDAANKDFIRAHELDSLIMSEGGAVSADYDANDKKYNDLLAEREQLVSNYATNPANKQDWSASAQYADQIASNYESKLKGMRDATRFSNAATSMYSGNIRENNDYVLYEQARKLAKDAAKAYAAPSYGEHTGFGGYVKDMGTGAGKVFSDVDFWSRGLSAIDRDKNVRKIVNSLSEKGINVLEATEKELYDNLSPAQIALISSFLLDAQAQYERSLDTARGYNAGVTFAESIGYMAEFLATGGIARAVGSAGKAASSGFGKLLANELSKGSEAAIKSKVSRGLINTFTKGGTKSLSKSAKAATNIASKAAGKAYSYGIRPAESAIWHTALQPSTYRTISENLTQINDNGDLVKAGSAIWGGVLDQLIENWSESMGGAVEDILGLPLKGVGAAGEKILGKTTLGQWGKWLADSASAKVLHEAGFNGLIGEMGEEWLGNAARVGLGLMTKDEFKDFASFESQVDMAASFAPMTLFGLGTSSYAAAKQDKNYRKHAKDMRGVLNRAGWSEGDVADVMDVKHTKEEIARTLAPVLQSIVRNSQDGKVAQEDYITTLKFAQAAAIQEVLSSAQTIEQERARKEMQEEIAQNLGAVPQEFKNEDGTTVIYPTDNRGNFSYTQVEQTPSGNYGVNVVTTAKDAKGEYFVIPDDDSDTMLLKNRNDANATPRFISRQEFQEQVDAGLMTTETSTLDNYLDARIEEKREMQRKYAENAQLEDKYQQVAQKMQVGSKINAGNEEAPMEGVVLAVDRGGVTVDFGQPVLLNGRNMQIHKLSLEQAGNFVGIDARIESEQRSVEEQVEQDEINSAKVKAYNQSLAGEQFTVDGHLYTYVHMFEMPQLDDDGTEIAHIVATDEQGRDVEMDIPLEDIKTRETDAAVKTNEQVEEVKDDNVLRDIHGNPIPMRVNEKTQQQEVDKRTFKNKDPEAYYAWNDAQRGGNTEDSMQAITADIASETAQLTALQKQLTVETDPDMRDELHESVNKTQNRINLLEGIYHKYDAENNFQDEQLDFAKRIYDVQSKLINAKTQEQVDALIKIKADLFRQYQLATVDSAENVMLAKRAVELRQVINSVADVPVQVVFESNIEAVMRTDGASEASINRVLSKVAELRSARITSGKDLVMTGLYNEGKVYIFAEGNTDASSALLTYYHERQHMRTAEDPEAMNKVLVLARNERDNLMQVLSLLTDNIAPYQGANNQELADEIVASAMEKACTDEKYEQTLRSRGLSEELINIIKTEYAKQRRITDSDAVRQEDWNANVRTSDTGNGQQDGAVEQGASGNGQLGTAQLSTDTGISEEEPQVDTTPRDFRGNPLPLEADGTTVDQKALWENDPEAWARWNDDINNDAGADSIAYINAVIEKLNKAIKTNEKAYAKATDFDKRDTLKGQIKEEKQRLDELQAILRAYRQKQSEEASAKMQADAVRAREARKAKAEELAKYNTESLQDIKRKWEDAPKDTGDVDSIVLANGERIEGHYVLTEAFAPTPSHDPVAGYSMTKGFPVDENGNTVNDRDYQHDKEAQRLVEQKASSFDQRALQTPVVVSSDGVVLSGNDRTMASQIAARQGTDNNYNTYLASHPQRFGFTADQISNYSNPRVVFVPDSPMPYTAATFAKFNAEEKKTQSKTESAVKAGKTISPEAVEHIAMIVNEHESIAETYSDKNAVAAILRILIDSGVVQESEISRLMDGDSLSGTGEDLVESVILGAVMREDALRCAMGDKMIRRSVMSALTQLLKNNTYGEYSLSGEFSDAVVLLYQAKRSGLVEPGESVANFMNQPVLDGFGDNPLAEVTVQMLANTINGTKVNGLKNVLSLYNARAEMAASGQADLFLGSVEAKEQIIREILNEYGYNTETFTAAAAEQRPGQQSEQQSKQGSSEEQAPDAVSGDAGSGAEEINQVRAIEEQRKVVDTEPTEAQKEAGNYRMGHVRIDGLDITIENPRGSIRKGTDADGHEWQTEMHNDYGYIRGTKAVDDDHIDVFLSDNPTRGKVYVIDQVDPKTGEFDESKVMYGFDSEQDAREAYLSNYEDGWQGLGKITEVSKEEFKKWIDSSTRKTKPFSEYASVKAAEAKKENTTDNQGNPVNEDGTLKVEKIKSIDDLTDSDFSKPYRNVALPDLPGNVNSAIGADGKPVIIKKSIFEKVSKAHSFAADESRNILKEALYNPDIVGQSQPKSKKNNWIAIKIDDSSPIVVLEVNRNKDNVEIVGWYTLDNRNLERIKRQAEREDGELLILTPKGAAASLSTLPSDLSSDGKFKQSSEAKQENGELSDFATEIFNDTLSGIPEEVRARVTVRESSTGDEVEENFIQSYDLDGKPSGISRVELFDVDIDGNPTRFVIDGSDVGAPMQEQERWQQLADEYKQLNPEVIIIDWEESGISFNTFKEASDFLSWAESFDKENDAVSSQSSYKKNEPLNKAEDSRFRIVESTDEEILSDSNQKDSEYFAAIERGDMEEAQRIVNEFAQKAGYTTISDYQGTSAFNGAAPYGNPYFFTKEERKDAWDNDKFEGDQTLGDYIERGIDANNLDFIALDPRNYRAANSMRKEAIDNVRNAIQKRSKTITMFRSVPSEIKEGSFRNGDWVTPSRAYAVDNAQIHGWGDNYNIIKQTVSVDEIWWDGNDIAEWGYGREEDYVKDTDFAYKNTKNNRKLLDVITRDDKGNIIPPSRRFDSGNADERYQISGRKAIDKSSEESRIAYEAVKEQLDRIGIPVELLSDQAMREMAINTNALETVSSQDEYQQTVVSSASGTKVINNLDNLAKSLENEPKTKEKTFLGALAKALDAKKHGSNSQYATFEAKNGTVVTIRLANHNVTTSTFDNHGENDGISIVVSARKNNGIINDGKAHVTEFYYDAIKLRKAEGKPLVDIVKSVKQSLYSGEYKDTTGLAQREEVNAKDVPEFMTVYHGSGAKFDKFDHSHMGEGEGVQAYGWGTYVTEVEGIGRTYAKAMAAKDDGALPKRNLYTVEIPEDINSALSKDEILKGLDSIGKELFSGYGLNDVQINAVFGTTREWYKFGYTATSDYFPLKEAFKAYGIDAETIDKRIHDEAMEDRQKNPAGYGFYLNWAGRIDMWIEKLGISEDEYERYDMATGRDAYRYLESKLGGAKEASDYLSDHGYVGISYPAQYRSGGRSDGARNYVIFNENNAKIVDRIEFLREPDGTVYGATVGGKIYLNRERLNPNTPIHEYTHLWFSALKDANPELYKRGVELMKQLPIWEEVRTDPNYANLSGDDAIASECLSRLVGDKGADVLTKMAKDANVRGDIIGTANRISLIEKFKDWLKKFWTWVRDSFTPWTKEEAARVSVDDIQNMVLSDLAKGVNPLANAREESEMKKTDDKYNDDDFEYLIKRNPGSFDAPENGIRFRIVTEPKLIEQLNLEPTVKVFRAMQIVDGELFPPMSITVNGKKREPSKIGQWEQSEENPELADEDGYFKLNKGKNDKGENKSLKAKYNPYFHTSLFPLNDQFSEAQTRSNIVIVEGSVPKSELTSGYRAEKAKDSVGKMTWHSGPVAGILGQYKGKEREVVLSRWFKPERIVPYDQIADISVQMFKGTSLEKNPLPSNVFHPDLRNELEKRGVSFVETNNRGQLLDDAEGRTWSSLYGKEAAGKKARVEAKEQDVVDMFYDADELSKNDEIFNMELENFKDNKHKGLLHLGKPLAILKASGINAEEMTISPSVLHRHLKKHGLTTDDLKGLARSIQSPILVYKHGKNSPNIVAITELDVKEGKLSASFELDSNGRVVDVSNISSVHSKEAKIELERLYKMGESDFRNALRWVEKGKVLDWLAPSSYKLSGMQAGEAPFDIANIVKSFENPRVSFENIANEGDMLPDGTRFRIVGGNSGYVGYSMSKRAAEAKEEGRFPKTQFVKEYGVPATHLDALVAAGIISNDEWHHTSKFGNKTPFYGWVEDSFLQAYNDNKAAIEDIIEQYNGTDPLSFTERRKLAEKIGAIIESSESVVSAREPAEALIAQREAEKAHRRDVMSEMANSDGKIKKAGNEYWYNADNQVSLHMRDNGRIIDIEFPIGPKTQSQRDKLYKAAQEEFREAYERAEKILQDKANENSEEQKLAPDVESSESHFRAVKSYDGLQSFGQDKLFDIMHKTFANLPESTRTKITKLAPAHGYKFHEATADYFASLATKKDLSEEEKMDVMVVRDNIKAALDIDYLSCSEALWALYNTVNKNSKDILSIARRTLVADKLGFMPEDRSKRDDVKDGVRFSIRENSHGASAAEIYNKATSYWYSRLRESYVDMNESVNDLVAAIESTTKQPAQAFEDVRLAINRQSSKGLNQMTKFMSDYLEPMWGAVGKVMETTGMTYDEVVRYVMLKHAVERNDVFARRDARRFYERKCDSIISKLKDEKKQKENMRKRAMANAEISIAYALDQEIQNIDKQIDSALKSLDRQLVKVDNGTSTKYKELREQDYGGLTSMYSKYPGLGARSDYATDEEYNKAARKVRVPMYDNVSDMENAARSEVNAFEKRTSGDEFNELWRRINAATKKTLESQYDNNIISREQYNAARDQFKYYVPLRGFKDTEAEDIWTYMDVSLSGSFAPALKNAKGRKSEAENPFNWIGTMASSAIAQNVKNEAKLALYYFIANRPNQDLVTIGKVWYQYDAAATAAHAAANPGDTRKIFTPVYPPVTTGLGSNAAKDAYDTWEADMRAKAAAGEAYLRTNKLNVQDDVAFISDKQVPQHVIKLKVRGEEMNLYINGDPRAAQAINGMLNIETNGGYQKVFGPILRWMSAVNTSYNPEFWISNLQRDFLFALMSSSITGEGANNLLKGFVNPKKIMQMMRDYEAGKLGNSREENYYREFAEGGGITGFTVIVGNEVWEKKIQEYLSPSDFAKISKSIKFDKFLKFFNDLGEAVEQMSRFAAFISARETGKSIEEAVAASKEITVNFNRKGSGKAVDWADLDKLTTADGAKLNKAQKLAVFTASFIPAYGRRFIMFFNAAVQGANAMYKLWKKDHRKTLAWASGYFAIGVLQAVLHALADDDDDYLDIPDYTKRSNLLLGGGGIYFKWALPQEMRPFYAWGDIFVNQVMGREPNKNMLLEMANSAADILPLGPGGVLPSVIQPSWDLYTNKDFTGSRIYNDNKYLSDAEREARPNYKDPRPQTNKLFIDISQVLNALSGGNEYSAGAVNVHPESMQHVVESLGGGLLTTMNKTEETVAGALGAIIGEDMIDQDLSVRRFPFLNRVLMVNDERTRNSHVSDLYYYYKDMSDVVEDKMRRMKKEMNYDALEKLQNSPEYEVYQIVKSYKKMMQRYDDDLKAEEDRNERKNIMREQDELRKEMINEISQTR